MKNPDNKYNLEVSNFQTRLIIDTFTNDGKVVVEKFQADSIK